MSHEFSLVKPNDLLPIIQDKSLGDASLNVKLASAQIGSEAHLSGALPVDFTFHVGGDFAVTLLNGKNGTDDDGVVGVADADTPAGQLTPLVRFDKVNGWLKYAAHADVKADVTANIDFVTFVGGAGAQLAMADYHRHGLGEGLRTVLPVDLAALRSAMVLSHVQDLPDGDALTFQTEGQLNASIDIAWSDVFTSEISGLARLLRAAAPIAIKTAVGASCSVKISVDDGFIVAFARSGGRLRVAVRRSHINALDAAGGVKCSVEIADPGSVETVLDDVVAGLLGTTADRVKGLLNRMAAGALSADDSTLVATIVDRLKLAGANQIDAAVADLKSRAAEQVKKVVESKVEASFLYEYHRVSSDVSLFEAEIVGTLSPQLHEHLVGGEVDRAFGHPASEIVVTKFLNDKTTTVGRAWGFTLGLNKWSVFGKDRRDTKLIEHVDRVAKTISRSYIGSGGYERTRLAWTVDFAADMPRASQTPLVGDYQFGVHMAVVRDLQPFTSADLETALDFAALWNICPESALPFVRQELSAAVNQKAEWSFHLRVNDEAFRPMARSFGAMVPGDFAGAAAAALDHSILAPVSARRSAWTPLWQAVLASAETCNGETARLSADRLFDNPLFAFRERTAADASLPGFDFSTVAGTIRADSSWFDDCANFSRGCRMLADAIAAPTPDNGQVADVYRKMVGFWVQSHYVRTLGAAFIDCARAVNQFRGVERTINLKVGDTTMVVSSNQF